MPSQSTHVSGDPSPTSDTLELHKIVSVLLERLWLVVVCLVLSGIATFAYLYRAVPVFEATASLKLDSEQPRLLDLPNIIQDDMRTPQMIDFKLKEVRRLLISPALLARVAETNSLATDPRFAGGSTSGGTSLAQLVLRLARLVTIEIPRSDTVVSVTVEHPNPELTAQLANSLADQLILHTSRSKEQIIKMASAKLEEMLRTLQDEWRVSERSLQTNRSQSLELGYQLNDLSQRLNDLNRMRIEATLQRIAVEAEQNEVHRVGTNLEALLKVSTVGTDQGVVSTRTTIAQKELLFNNLKQRYKPKHPRYVEAESELVSLRQTLANAIATAAQGVRVSLDGAKAKEDTLQKDYEALNGRVQVLTRDLIQSTNNPAAREFDMQRSLQDKVMARLKEASLSSDLFSAPLHVFQRAEVPLKPTKPDKVRVTLVGLLVGLVVGVGLALALGLVDSSFRSVEEVERFLNLPVIGAVPRVPALATTQSQVVMADEDHFIAAEAFRSLRTSVSVLAKERELRSFVFTSATPEEGKTFCALNYAASLAQQGLRTLLVECDLRRPMAAVALAGLKADAPGVTDYLRLQPAQPGVQQPVESPRRNEGGLSFTELRRKQRGSGDAPSPPSAAPAAREMPTRPAIGFDDIVQKTEIENLSFVSAGAAAPNPAELLARQGISKLVGEAVRRFDRVVIDAAPMLGISDSLLLVSHAQATCLVIRAHRTPRKAVMRAVGMLQRAEAPLLGVILNDLSMTRSDQYGDYFHYYGQDARSATKAV